MNDNAHKLQWESLRDLNLSLFKSTGDILYDIRYKACLRLLGEANPKKDSPTHIA